MRLRTEGEGSEAGCEMVLELGAAAPASLCRDSTENKPQVDIDYVKIRDKSTLGRACGRLEIENGGWVDMRSTGMARWKI